jgi:exportin-2 (importin alpha re-exporter)
VSGHALAILQLVASLSSAPSAGLDAAIRQAAAVHFKNLIQKGWDTEQQTQEEGSGVIAIVLTEAERHTIKSHLVQLMCETPPRIQVQLSTAIALIATCDYYQNWQDLLPSLVQQFQSTDIHVVIGVLKTANSIFKSFRYVARSDALYATIIYTLERCQVQLLALLKHLSDQVQALLTTAASSTSTTTTTDKQQVVEQVKLRLEALRLCHRIFYSLNYQDLPAYFEDNMAEIMTEFAKYLQAPQQQPNDLLLTTMVQDPTEELEPSSLDQLQAAIINNLALYADKDEEVFIEQFLPQFTSLVWNNLLVTVTPQTKHDLLATTSIKFLSSLVSKPMHANLFVSSPETLPQIVSKIVIPNLYLSPGDVERFFEDNESDGAHEYMVTEVEGSDSESRRKCAQDLLRSMCRQYETETTRICSNHVSTMLQTYTVSPHDKWADKDAAVRIVYTCKCYCILSYCGCCMTCGRVFILKKHSHHFPWLVFIIAIFYNRFI